MHPKNLSIFDFSYSLPAERIAKYPLKERDAGKLLVFKNGKITPSVYRNLDEFLPDETLLIFNNTKVVAARLLFQKTSGGIIEVFCLEPDDTYPDITTAMLKKGKVRWKCLVGGAGKWKHGMVLKKNIRSDKGEVVLEAAIVDRVPDCFVIELRWQPAELSFAEVLHLAGFIPLPPYLHRDAEEEDKSRYQTVYAKNDGSVAAPTAGLHFTEMVFEKLRAKNIHNEFVTLHVGAGTFKPVKSARMIDHEMHAEFLDVPGDAIQTLINYLDKTIVAVGTTSLRTIESLYWMGVKLLTRPDVTIDEISIQQWDPYEVEYESVSAKDALVTLQTWMAKNQIPRLITKTQIIIAPGYSLRVAKGIITNFHQPQSTLLLLIAAIVGDEWKKIYEYAMNNDFRFLSYGDGCLLWGRKVKSEK
jgi:S-adenosylmethionine:tRNA ribosyltransferase-isomerase